MTGEEEPLPQEGEDAEAESEGSPDRAFVPKRVEARVQLRRGNKAWLDSKYAMVVDTARMNRDNNQMEYQLSYDGQTYNNGEWVKQDRLRKG